jgi:copper chaperone CopZ
MQKTTITIQGTHCNACKLLIEDVAKDVAGVKSCTVDFQTGQTLIEHDETLNWNALKQEINSLGKYQVYEK